MKYIILFLFFHFINVNAQSTLSFHSKKGNGFEYINVDSISLGEKGTDGYIPSVYASGYCLPISLANIDSITFSETPECRNWYDIMNFPSRETIDNYNNSSTKRSPYIYSWLTTNCRISDDRLHFYTSLGGVFTLSLEGICLASDPLGGRGF